MSQTRKDNQSVFLYFNSWLFINSSIVGTETSKIVDQLAKVVTLDSENLFNIKLVISELVINEFKHGLGKNVHLSVALTHEGYLDICVYGAQEGFNLEYEISSRKRMEFDDYSEDGRGLVIVESLCESLTSEISCEGSIVRARMLIRQK